MGAAATTHIRAFVVRSIAALGNIAGVELPLYVALTLEGMQSHSIRAVGHTPDEECRIDKPRVSVASVVENQTDIPGAVRYLTEVMWQAGGHEGEFDETD